MNEVWPDWMTNGIFTKLQTLTVPWQTDDIAEELDLAYHGIHSGEKIVSPLIDKMRGTSETLTEANKQKLANVALALNHIKWTKEWQTMSAQYDPLKNYDMTEEIEKSDTTTYGRRHTRTDDLTHAKTGTETSTPNLTETRTDDLTHAKTGTEGRDTDTQRIRTDNLTDGTQRTETLTLNTHETTTPALTTTETGDVYGFNSAAPVPAGKQTTQATGTQQTDRTGTETTGIQDSTTHTGTQSESDDIEETLTYNTTDKDTGTQQTTKRGTDQMTYNTTDTDTGTVQEADTGTDTVEGEQTLRRSGNIGVTTSQQMLQSERDLWMWSYFEEIIFPDLDKVLTSGIY